MNTNSFDICYFDSYDVGNKSSGALVVSTDKTSMHDVMFNKMGFKGDDDYLDAYPGHFNGFSDITKNYLKYNVDPDQIIPSVNYGLNISSTIFSMSSVLDDIKFLLCVNNFFMFPTVKEVKSCAGFENIAYENLWFCTDWKEPNNDS